MKWVIAGLLVLSMASCAYAEIEISDVEPLKMLPAVENGWYYDFNNGEIINATGAKIIGGPKDSVWEGLQLGLMWGTGVGDGGERSENLVMGTLGYNIGALDQFGLELPLKGLLDITINLMYGYNLDGRKPAYGIGGNIVKIKF